MNISGPDVHQTLEYRGDAAIVKFLPVGLALCFLGLLGFALDDDPPATIVFASWVLIVAGSFLTGLAIWRRSHRGRPLFVLSPAGILYRIPSVKEILIPWREIKGVDTVNITTWNWSIRRPGTLTFRDVTVISLYLPSGSSGPHRQASKFRFLAEFLPHLAQLRQQQREIILCGDWNIAHQPIDLKNWRSNQKNSGFLPEERAWLTRVFDDLGFVDVFRKVDPRAEQYTWWSNRGEAWANNVGWRIDYQIATPAIAAKAHAAAIYKNRRFSDHAPLVIDYDFVLR